MGWDLCTHSDFAPWNISSQAKANELKIMLCFTSQKQWATMLRPKEKPSRVRGCHETWIGECWPVSILRVHALIFTWDLRVSNLPSMFTWMTSISIFGYHNTSLPATLPLDYPSHTKDRQFEPRAKCSRKEHKVFMADAQLPQVSKQLRVSFTDYSIAISTFQPQNMDSWLEVTQIGYLSFNNSVVDGRK